MTPKTTVKLVAAVPTAIFVTGTVLLMDFNAELMAFFEALPLSNSLGLLASVVYVVSMVAFMPMCGVAWDVHHPEANDDSTDSP